MSCTFSHSTHQTKLLLAIQLNHSLTTLKSIASMLTSTSIMAPTMIVDSFGTTVLIMTLKQSSKALALVVTQTSLLATIVNTQFGLITKMSLTFEILVTCTKWVFVTWAISLKVWVTNMMAKAIRQSSTMMTMKGIFLTLPETTSGV